MIADLLIAVALALAIVVATVWPELACNDDARMRDGRCAVCGRQMGTTGEAPSSLAGMRESVVVNPSAIGDPAEDPVVFVGADLRALLNPCACGGVNGFHAEGCQVTA